MIASSRKRPFRFNTMAFCLLLLFYCATFSPAHALDLYVSPNGNDTANGLAKKSSTSGDTGPFATLGRAREAIRTIKNEGAYPDDGITVHLAPGNFILNQPLVLTSDDSGTPKSPILYRAEKTGLSRIIGGSFLSNFNPVTDTALLNQLDPSARNNVFSASLTSLGITDYGSANGKGLELFFNGKPMQISRWPNEGFAKIAGELGDDPFDVRGRTGDRTGRWVYENDRHNRWLNEKDAWLYGYWFWDWSAEHQKIKSIDPENNILELEKPYHNYGYKKGQWYYALNLLSEIDTPGEWYLDRDKGELYFWPPSSIKDAEIFISQLPTAIEMNDVSHCTIRGIVIEGFRDTAIRISGGSQNQVVACTIRNSGSDAIHISGGSNNAVIGCDIYEMGGSGIILNGGDRKTLTPAGHLALNNHIHHYGRWYRMYKPGISLSGVGHRAAYNLINDAPHMAIQFSGNDHVIENNEIHSVCYESNDAGAIYAGRDWTQRGTIIRSNFLHHIMGFEDRGCVGVYLDDMFSGTHIYDNLFYQVYRAAFIGGGRDNIFSNNMFIDCPRALHIDNRAQNWASYHVDTTMTDRLNDMPFAQSPWKDRFPELLTILQDEPAAPKGNSIRQNIFYGEKWNDIHKGAQPYIQLENNLENSDPLLASPESFRNNTSPKSTDFKLKKKSPAFELGFKPLPLKKMGSYADPDRATWPIDHQVRTMNLNSSN